MKKRILALTLPLLAGLLLLGGCYDSVEQRISQIREQLSALESRASSLNEQLSSLSSLVSALENNEHILSIKEWKSGSKTGYRISFTSGSSLIVSSGTDGAVPLIGVRFNEQFNAYYWTIQMGESGTPTWMTNSYGQRVRASGTVPQLKIEDGVWWYSFDGGTSWNKTGWGVAQGENGTSVFTSVDTSDPYYVIFTMTDKTVIKIPTQEGYDQLSRLCDEISENLEIFIPILAETDSSVFVKSVVAIGQEGEAAGYRITFEDGSEVDIYNGRNNRDSMEIVVRTYTDGKHYFAYRNHSNDQYEWVRYQGKMVCADIAEVTPKIGITDSLGTLYFTIAYGDDDPEIMRDADGNAVQATGSVVLDFFTDIDLSDPNSVVLIMEDGSRIALPRTRSYMPSLTLLVDSVDVAPGLEYTNQLVAILTDTLTSRVVCPDFNSFCELTGSHLEAISLDGGTVNPLRVASFVGRQITEGVAYTAHVAVPFTTAPIDDWDVTRKTRIAVFYTWGTSSLMKVAEFGQIILVSEVILDPHELTINEGESHTLDATVLPANASDKTVNWTSSNTTVARVSKDGVMTAVSAGTATITAESGGKSDSCKVTVVIPTSGVKLSKTELELNINTTYTLTATVLPATATDKHVTWSTSNDKVATVNQEGLVSAVGAGTATITATCGGKSATCKVTVKIPVSSVTLDKSSATMYVDSTLQLKATVKPDNATDKTVTWTSSNTGVATVSNNGLVKAVAAGTTTITASSGGKSATCKITVQVPVSSVTLDKTEVEIFINSTFELKATVLPEDASDKTITWTSSNTSIATVTQEGVVNTFAPGTATITASAVGGKSATCKVTVLVPVNSITLDKTYLSLYVGGTATLTATVLPSHASDKTVTWTSSNEKVAKVSKDGVVTAIGAGECDIVAKAGEKTATCTVNVLVPVSSVTLDKTSAEVFIDSTITLKATVLPANASDKTVTWTTSDETIATVTQDGVVKTLALGTCTITASAGGKSATCEITVIPRVVVTSITLEETAFEVFVGESHTLKAVLLPEDATDKSIKWTTSNAKIATVSDKGVVMPTGPGSCTITATTANGLTATATFTVFAAPKFTDAIFKKYVLDNFDTDHDGFLSRNEAKVVTNINVASKSIKSLSGIECFDALTTLNCTNNQLTELDVSHNPVLSTLYCYNNALDTLALSGSVAMLICFNNQLKSLDVQKTKNLSYLECTNNLIDSLNLSNLAALQTLICENNKMKKITLAGNTALTQIQCQVNELTALDIAGAKNLKSLQCNDNKIKVLDISQNLSLTYLNALNNPLETLYIATTQTVASLKIPGTTAIVTK